MPAPKRQDSRQRTREALRRDPAAKTIARSWRSLTGPGRNRDDKRRTLIACSGGTDSSALLLALAAHAQPPNSLVVAHIVHDLRPRKTVLAERDRVRVLAEQWGLEFAEAEAHTRRATGNAEANARQTRYAALADLAESSNCTFIATAHHADDLAETLLMRLLRGAGPRGLVGIHESRPLTSPFVSSALTLIRPMLAVTRADAVRLCRLARWKPNDDATNRDTTRLRARLRKDVLPTLRAIAPHYHERLLDTSRCMAATADALDAALTDSKQWGSVDAPAHQAIPREKARALPTALLAEFLRECVRAAHGSLDKLSARTLTQACAVIQGPGTDPKLIRLPNLELNVTAHTVEARPLVPQSARAPKRP